MKSPNFHSEISILTFLLLWSMSQFPFCVNAEDLKDVQVKIIKGKFILKPFEKNFKFQLI